VAVVLSALPGVAVAIDTPYGWSLDDPRRFVDKTDPNWCEQCHEAEFAVWAETSHAKGFRAMRQRDRAREIADKMGITSVTRDSRCLTCHFTIKERAGKQTAVSGVSCQSCHGAARDWVGIHHDHGEGKDHFSETAAHKRQRIEKARRGGMRRPSDFYPSARTCYRCHLVPDEELVNVGGHRPGSSNFELVARTQEEIRHNFLASRLREEEPVNAERPAAYKRRMYVMGRALALEYSLRGLAVATEPGTYLDKMIVRVEDAIASLDDVQRTVPVPEVARMLDLARGAELGPGRKRALERTAEEIGKLNRQLVRRHDGSQWAAIDPLLEGELPDALAGPGPPVDGGGVVPDGGVQSGDAGSSGGSAGAPTGPTYARKRHIRPIGSWDFLSAGECSGCHDDSWAWYEDHAHAKSVDPFRRKEADVLRIARKYGVPDAQVATGASVCMDCHSTVAKRAQGRSNRKMRKGVDCQGCHGAAEQYLDPHKAEEGTGRAYDVGVANGMVKVRDLASTAANCTSCHYVTDQRLLASGHPSGKGFDFAKGMASVKHWERPLPSAGAIQRAFGSAIAARGGVPDVEEIRTPVAIASAPVRTTARPGGGRSAPTASAPAPRPAAHIRQTAVRIDLPPLPELPEDATPAERLRLVQERLERLREQLATGGSR